MLSNWKVGDWVVYRKQKRSASPGPRAKEVHPDEHGERYGYVVDKYWVVEKVEGDGAVHLVTRRGKRHAVAATDPRLRPASWWECWLLGRRFRAVEQTLSGG